VQFAFILAGGEVGTLVVKGRWLPWSAVLAAAAGYVLSLVITRLLVRVSRRWRRGGGREGARQSGSGSPSAWSEGSASAGGSVDLILRDAGPRRISVIKAIVEIGHLGLGEAKELVDQAPCAVLTGVSDEVATAAAAHLSSVGAMVLVRPSAQPNLPSLRRPADGNETGITYPLPGGQCARQPL
jgi:ribosomal protein L7/L12